VTLLPFPALPAALVSPGALADLEALVGRFVSPSGLLIECPLGEGTASADLSVALSRPAGGGDARVLLDGWPAGTAWDGVRRFVETWRNPSGPLGSEAPSVWLEFDVRRGDAAPLPNAFFGHRNGLRSRATMRAGFDLLLEPDAIDERALISAGVDALPRDANVLFAGVMLARRPAAIRFCVDGPPWQDAPAGMIQRTRHVIVQIEAGANAHRIGFELYQGRRQRGRADVWRPLLEWLVAEGVAREDRCASALEWPGYAYDGSHVVARWINHVKVTCEAGACVEAKVYLQFAPAWAPSASDAGGRGF